VHNPSQDGWAGDLKNTTWTITGCSGRKRSQCIDRKRVCGRKIYLATGHQLLLILNWHSIKIFCKLSFYLRHATLRPTLRGSYWSSCYSIFNLMCMFCRSLFVLCIFSFCHCVVCSSSIYGVFNLFFEFAIYHTNTNSGHTPLFHCSCFKEMGGSIWKPWLFGMNIAIE
jgi:hypothetical protein